ncbi:MAG: YHYH protein [Bacteroidota bacterium]
MFKNGLLFLSLFCACNVFAQLDASVTSWILNTNSDTGYNGLTSNVQQVQYSANNVYVSCSCIPGYDIGPWQGNPNTPSNQNFVFKITRNPAQNTGTLINTALGHIGVWSNGVSIYNQKDGNSYSNQNVWHQNAIVVEGVSFDDCLGHPAGNGEYHHHLNPTCLYDDTDNTQHSPVIGFAFDGFPIYGAYGYTNANGTGAIKRMESSYRMRAITTRTTLADGSTASNPGPAVSLTYPLGYYLEDFEYVQGLGDLDAHNGRFSITPEYPNGTYAYFVTLDSSLEAVFPYILGLQYYGTVQAGNTGPASGHNSVTETVSTYSTTSVNEQYKNLNLSLFPNPASDILNIAVKGVTGGKFSVCITDMLGKKFLELKNMLIQEIEVMDIKNIPSGLYTITLKSENYFSVSKFVTQK